MWSGIVAVVKVLADSLVAVKWVGQQWGSFSPMTPA